MTEETPQSREGFGRPRRRRVRAASAVAAVGAALLVAAGPEPARAEAAVDGTPATTTSTTTTTTTTTRPPRPAPTPTPEPEQPSPAPTTTGPPPTAPALDPLQKAQEEQRARLAALQAEADELAKQIALARAELGELDVSVERVQNEIGEVLERIDERRQLLAKRAVAAYKGDYGYVSVLLEAADPTDFLSRIKYLAETSDRDQEVIGDLLEQKDGLQKHERELSNLQVTQREKVAEMQARQKELGGKLGQMVDLMSALPQQQAIAVNGFVFPVTPPFTFSNDFGAPRSGPPPHPHAGNDIFCVYGAPLRAVESGVITKMGAAGLGGERIWLHGDTGTDYYYAHLSGYYPGQTVGTRVNAGDFVGFCGQSGNARSTPPHVHFEIHPLGATNPPINPYPILRATQLGMEQAEQKIAETGTAGDAQVTTDATGAPIGIKVAPGQPAPAAATTPSGGTPPPKQAPVRAAPKRNVY